jgi:hypothetical protein
VRSAKGIFNIKNFDRDGRELNVGDRVGFVMRGWFLPREQESFGVILEIDPRGGIKIDVVENYRRFTSSGRLAIREKVIFFTHHTYCSKSRTRKFAKEEEGTILCLFKIEKKFPNANTTAEL